MRIQFVVAGILMSATLFAQQRLTTERPFVGIVNGDTVWVDEFSHEVGRRAELNANVESVTQNDVMQSAWNDVVTAILLRQEATKRGLVPTDKQIDSVLLLATPDFVRRGVVDEKGQFDPSLLRAMVTNPDSLVDARGQKLTADQKRQQKDQLRKSISELKGRVGYTMTMERLTADVTSKMQVDTAILRKRFHEIATTATVEVLYFPCPAFSAEPTAHDLEAYYNSHSDNYSTDVALRKVAIVAWPLTATPLDSTVMMRSVQGWVDTMNRTKSAMHRDTIWFDVASTIATGNAKLHPDSATHERFYKACSGKAVGSVVGPFVLQSGVHVLYIDSIATEKPTKKKIYSVRVGIIEIPASRETIDSILREVDVATDMYDRGTVLGDVAKKFNKQIEISPYFSKSDKIYGSYNLAQSAFRTQLGTASDPIDALERGVVLSVVVDSIPPGKLSLDAAVDRVRADWLRESSCNSIKKTVESYGGIVTMLEGGTMMVPEAPPNTSIQRGVTVTMDGLIGENIYDPLAAQVICNAKTNGLMQPFRGDAGWYIVNVQSTNKANDAEFGMFLMQNGDNLAHEQHQMYWEKWKKDLMEKATIVDNRGVYFRF